MAKLTVSNVVKQDAEVMVYLLVYGVVTYLANEYLVSGPLSLIFGAGANYLVYRIRTELEKNGYREALK